VVTFKFKSKEYQIVPEESTVGVPPFRSAESLLSDFEYCMKVRDYQTIKNRITGGLLWGWIKELKNN
jgi:hypothetical protein|tara:strand:- start:321 stop:521 length:201 start_codon:yes stop_codon:yes gene_type:complete